MLVFVGATKLVGLLLFVVGVVDGVVTCPRLPSGATLTCAVECCPSLGGKDQASERRRQFAGFKV